MSAMSNRYTSVVDSETYTTVRDDSIIEIDSHLGAPIPHGQYTHPDVSPEQFDILADELRSVGRNKLATRMEIEKRHLEDDSAHVFRFTAIELAEIVVSLAIAKTKVTYQCDMDASIAITDFGRLVTESTDELLAESAQYTEIPDLKPIQNDRSFIDPFAVISSTQQLIFVDAHGEKISEDDLADAGMIDDVL